MDLESLKNWTEKRKINIHPAKFLVMMISIKKITTVYNYTRPGHQLKHVNAPQISAYISIDH